MKTVKIGILPGDLTPRQALVDAMNHVDGVTENIVVSIKNGNVYTCWSEGQATTKLGMLQLVADAIIRDMAEG